jgi:hypothetical protein
MFHDVTLIFLLFFVIIILPVNDMIRRLYLCLFTAVLCNVFHLIVMLHLKTISFSVFPYIWKWFTLVFRVKGFLLYVLPTFVSLKCTTRPYTTAVYQYIPYPKNLLSYVIHWVDSLTEKYLVSILKYLRGLDAFSAAINIASNIRMLDEWRIENDLERIHHGLVEVISWNYTRDRRKPRKSSVRILLVPVGIRTEHFLNTSLEYYRFGVPIVSCKYDLI